MQEVSWLNLFFVSFHEPEVGNNKAELLRDGREITTDRDLSPSSGMIKRDFAVSNKLLLPSSLHLSCRQKILIFYLAG